GLVSALFLQQHGVRVEIVDMHQRTTQHSYALAIHPRTLQVLDEAGLSEGLIAAGRKLTRVAYYEGRDRHAEIDYSRLASRHPFPPLGRQDLPGRGRRGGAPGEEAKGALGPRVPAAGGGGAHVLAEVAKLVQAATGYPVARTEWVVARSETIRPSYV